MEILVVQERWIFYNEEVTAVVNLETSKNSFELSQKPQETVLATFA